MAAEPKRGRGRVRIRRVSDAAIFVVVLLLVRVLLSFPLLWKC